jgi:aspartyl-tRNA(Asn)/glutamyl-tRNA(Gln) amidotransferase subunit A
MTSPTELTERPISAHSASFHSGETTPTDLIDATLTNISRLEDKLAAFEIVLADNAREAADAATKAIASGHRIGPFHGIPFALKDLIDVEGLRTTGGTRQREDHVAEASAAIARRLIAAGGILIGKTKTVEVAYGAWGTNQVRGTPWNPWDAETHRMPGGSSSGSGVAVAARMATCAVGTDTGGSVRIPSAACGLTGLKVTEGRLPLNGIVPLSHTLDTPGPMARSVEDAAIMFEVMDGRHPANTDRDLRERNGLFAEIERGVSGLTLGCLTDADRDGIDQDVVDQYDDAITRLKMLGAEIVPFALPVPIEHMKRDVGTLISSEGYFHHGDMYETPSNQVDTDVAPRILLGAKIPSKQYIQALVRRQAHKVETLKAMDGLAAFLTPTMPTLPLPISEVDQSGTPAVFTRGINYLGFCATAQPIALTSAGLPTSLQTAARPGDETMALRIAAAYERDAPAIGAPPMIQS